MTPTKTTTDRIRLPFNFEVQTLQRDVDALRNLNYEYYKVIPLRSPAHLVDTTLPFPPPAENYADGSWTDWMDTAAMDATPYIKSIIQELEKITTVNLIRLLFLAPKSVVEEHTDPTLALEEVDAMIRLTIPIKNPVGSQFFLNGSEVMMNEGECWYLKLNDPHRVINDSDLDRVNLTIDVIPNAAMREVISQAARK